MRAYLAIAAVVLFLMIGAWAMGDAISTPTTQTVVDTKVIQ